MAARPTWGRNERIVVIVLIALFLLGAPGAGVETRDAASAPVWVAGAYTIAGVATLLALLASWKWPTPAAWLGVVGGGLAAVLSALDIPGVVQEPPPPAMIALDIAIVALGALFAWMCWRLTRRS